MSESRDHLPSSLADSSGGLDSEAARLAETSAADTQRISKPLSGTSPWEAAGASRDSRPLAIAGYEIEEELGRGGMGVVYRARQSGANRTVALKVIRPDKFEQFSVDDCAAAVQRFRTEAQAAARLRHDNIVTVYEVGEVDGRPFYSMQFVEGKSLAQLARGGPLDVRLAASYLEQVARAVQAAHELGVLHRDLKPNNVLLDRRDGRPLVADFGLAKLLETDGDMTMTGEVFGSPPYMSPEQALDSAGVTAATDIYGLGATLYFLIAGRPPFQAGSAAETLRRVIDEEPVAPRRLNPRVDRDLETICLKALAKVPQARYASAADLADDLRRYLADEPIAARRSGLASRLRKRLARHRRTVALTATVVAIAIAASGFFAVRASQARQITGLMQLLDRELEAEHWTADRLQAMDELLGRLDRLEPGQARQARQRMETRFVTAIGRLIHRPALVDATIAEIEGSLALLDPRDRQAAAKLRTEFDQRLRSWDEQLDFGPPFAEYEKVFDPADVEVDANGATLKQNRPAAGAPVGVRVACQGNVRVELDLARGSWEPATRVGVVVRVSDDEDYGFQLSTDSTLSGDDGEADREPIPLGQSWQTSDSARLAILRNGIPVGVAVTAVPGGDLHLAATRENETVSVQINDLPALTFRDLFPLGGRQSGALALDLPATARISQLRVLRQALPAAPSPLENGDYSFAQGRTIEALDLYRNQDLAANSMEIRQEARLKQALCLLELNRKDEAERLLDALAAEPGGQWPLVAAFHLWSSCLRQQRWTEADAIFENLSRNYRFEQMVVLLPALLRKQIVAAYFNETEGASLVGFNRQRLDRVERALEVERFVDGRPSIRSLTSVLRAYRSVEDSQRAADAALELLHRAPNDMAAIEEYSWIMRRQGAVGEAAAQFDRALVRGEGFDPNSLPLLVERARIHAALQHWREAESDLDNFFRLASPGQTIYRYWSAACLVQGLLFERRGDRTAAEQVWSQGLYQVWRQARLAVEPDDVTAQSELPDSNPDLFSGMEMVQFLILASLSDQLRDEDAASLMNWLTFRRSSQSPLSIFKAASGVISTDLTASALRGMWRTPRGRDQARRIGFQEAGFAECYRVPLLLAFYEAVRQGAFSADISPADDEQLWTLAGRLYAAYADGGFPAAKVIQLALAWKGATNFAGWAGVAPSLDPALRGPLAYVMGHRYRRLKRDPDAAELFRTARDDAPAESELRKLAQAELERLAPAQPPPTP